MTQAIEAPGRGRETTARALVSGLLLGALLAAGNVYSGAKLGIVDSGATVVILVSFGLFAAIRRPLAALEANIGQTAGTSAALMALTAGVVGPIPALVMGGHTPSPIWVALLAISLGVLGTLLAVPFRRRLIEEDALAFPSGHAAGELMKSLAAERESTRERMIVLFTAFGAAVLVVVARDIGHVIPADLILPVVIAGIPAATLGVGVSLSPLILGVGSLVGLRAALSWLAGGVIAWLVLDPILVGKGWVSAPDYGSAVSWLLWPGTALMVTSSLTSLAFGAGTIGRAWAARRRAATADAGSRWIRLGVVLSSIAVVLIGVVGFDLHPLLCLAALVMAGLFAIVSMRAIGETDQAPAGPLGGLAQILIGATAPGSTVSTLFAGGVTSGVSSHASAMMASWKAGRILDASPGRMMIGQLLGVLVGTAAAVLAYALLDSAYGIGSEALPSPSAVTWKATADVVQGGISTMPAGAPLAALIAGVAGVLLALLERGPAGRWVPSPVAVGIGFIVPASIAGAIAVGALVASGLRRWIPGWFERSAPSLAAGLITGEALTALLFAALLVLHVL